MPRWLVPFCALLLLRAPSAPGQAPTMTAHFIDVGQAHATLLEFPCGAMLIDAGSDEDHPESLVAYLSAFFQRRTDLNRTLNAVIITHNHKDHTQSLREVVDSFTVLRYFDNGFIQGSGVANPNWLKREVQEGHLSVAIREVHESTIDSVPGHTGLTDADIDPLDCGTVDPRVRILAARADSNPGWPEDDFTNQNNHSLVTRIDFGQASFLFMGDMEESGIEELEQLYGNAVGGVLDAAVLQVGHHGSHNGTTVGLLHAVTPRVAVIPMGPWTFGQGSGSAFTTFAYGHPRQDIVDLLSAAIGRKRAQARSVMLAERSRTFHQFTVRKAIYGTGWDGTVRVVATAAGGITVYREH